MNKKKCTCCGKDKRLNDFYSSNSPFYITDGKLPMCKECIWDYVDAKNYLYDLDRIKSVLRMMDRPFIKTLWDSSISESENSLKKNDAFKLYIKNLAMHQYKDLNYSHSDSISVLSLDKNETNDEYEEINFNQEDVNQWMAFFGKGFTIEDYLWLNEEYQDFLNKYECDSKGMELLIKQIVLQELDIEKRRAKGEKVDAQLKTLQDLLGSSNLKPVQETGANSVEHETFGTLIKKWENEHPIPEPDEKWKDVDGILKYITVFFTGHLARMLGKLDGDLKDEYEKEMKKFTVEEPERMEESEDDFI